jgi:hypothetical protein
VVAVLLFSMPASPWEFDEPLFFQALEKYDPVAHHPPPPGYPLFIGVAKVVRLLAPSDFAALVTISVLASFLGFMLLALAFGRFIGDAAAGTAGALLFYLSPTMIIHATLPISEPGALAVLAAALYFLSRGRHLPFAIFAALAVGWRIQFAIVVVPLFLVAVIMMRSWRRRFVALGAFTLVCLLWLAPLALAVGGVEKLIAFETRQAGYLAAHDADQSRSGWTPARIALRFIAHPWGTKIASFPVLLAAAVGAVHLLRHRRTAVVPLAAGAMVYIAFALRAMDPADGARYSIPFLLFTALLAAAGARRVPLPGYVLPAVFAAGSLIYVSSLIAQRTSSPSPPVQAARFARATYPKGAVVIYELSLWPHATYFLRDFQPRRFDDAMSRFYDRADVPMFIYADGAAQSRDAASFRWQPSDAYSKLTRNHYRVASIIPVAPETRFRAIRGIYPPEREPEGLAWRWLGPVAELQLPPGPPRQLRLRLGLPATSPIEANEVEIGGQQFVVIRGKESLALVDVPAGMASIVIRASRSFVPSEVAGSLSRDPRRLSVKLYGLETVSAERAPRRAAS